MHATSHACRQTDRFHKSETVRHRQKVSRNTSTSLMHTVAYRNRSVNLDWTGLLHSSSTHKLQLMPSSATCRNRSLKFRLDWNSSSISSPVRAMSAALKNIEVVLSSLDASTTGVHGEQATMALIPKWSTAHPEKFTTKLPAKCFKKEIYRFRVRVRVRLLNAFRCASDDICRQGEVEFSSAGDSSGRARGSTFTRRRAKGVENFVELWVSDLHVVLGEDPHCMQVDVHDCCYKVLVPGNDVKIDAVCFGAPANAIKG